MQQKLFRQKRSQRTYKIHDKSKAFKCDVCLKKFMSEGHLFQHYQTHTVEKLFSCQVCSRKFNYKYALIRHQVTLYVNL